jgi:hypothetical protein
MKHIDYKERIIDSSARRIDYTRNNMEDNIFRLALVLQENGTSNLYKYLYEYIKVALITLNSPSTVHDICLFLEENYNISFSSIEVLDVINKQEKKGNLAKENDKYELSCEEKSKTIEKLKTAESIDKYVAQYIVELSIDIGVNELSSLLNRFIYFLFVRYKSTIIEMLGKGKYNPDEVKMGDFEAMVSEKETINGFLVWENTEKNKFLYKVINAAFNYGMLTVKKWLNNQVFNGKKFILDTNVIVALSGIGSISRVYATQKFLHKARELNIEMGYTNITSNEINDLLVNKCSELTKFVQENGLINPRFLETYGTGGLEDFYVEYFEWTKTNDPWDINSFHKYIYKKVQNTLFSLKLKTVNASKYVNKPEFSSFCGQLLAMKQEKRGYGSKKTVENDVINFMYIDDLVDTKLRIWDSNYFIISIDRVFCLFADKNKNGYVASVIHPTVWLGLFLKFAGRTSDDLLAFTKFLQLPIDDHSKVELHKVIETMNDISDDGNVRSAILTELSYMLRDTKDLGDIDIKAMTKKAHEILIEQKDDEMSTRFEAEKKIIEIDVRERQKIKIHKYNNEKAEETTTQKMKKWIYIYKNEKNIKNSITVFFTLIMSTVFLFTTLLSYIIDLLNHINESSSVIIGNVIMYLIILFSGIISRVSYSLIIKKIGSIEDIKLNIFKKEILKQEEITKFLMDI